MCSSAAESTLSSPPPCSARRGGRRSCSSAIPRLAAACARRKLPRRAFSMTSWRQHWSSFGPRPPIRRSARISKRAASPSPTRTCQRRRFGRMDRASFSRWIAPATWRRSTRSLRATGAPSQPRWTRLARMRRFSSPCWAARYGRPELPRRSCVSFGAAVRAILPRGSARRLHPRAAISKRPTARTRSATFGRRGCCTPASDPRAPIRRRWCG